MQLMCSMLSFFISTYANQVVLEAVCAEKDMANIKLYFYSKASKAG